MSTNFLLRIVVPVFMAAAMLISCGGPDGESAIVSETGTSSPEINEAMFVYMSGDVSVRGPQGERIPAIGDTAAAGESIVTGGSGYAELQFGDLGAIRINENTIYEIDAISLSDSGRRTAGSLALGMVVSKVRQLSDRDSFEVRTPEAVCAVRGTEFLVRADERGSVTIAVAEGSVSVVPSVLAGADPVIEDESTIQAIEALMPIVRASEEIVLDTESFLKVEARLVTWEETDVETLTEQVRNALLDTPSAEPIKEANAAVIREAAAEMLSVSLESSGTEEETPALVTLTVTALPADTRIFLNNSLAGRGSISRIFADGTPVDVRAVGADGRVLERQVVAGTEAVVSLEIGPAEDPDPKAEEAEAAGAAGAAGAAETEASLDIGAPPRDAVSMMEIEAVPDDAVITVNGNRLGRGRARLEGAEGEQLRLLVERPGYAPYEKTIEMDPAVPVRNVALEPRVEVNFIQMPGPGIGSPAGNGRFAVAAAGEGSLIALDSRGRPVWVRETRNRSGENTSPVIIGNRVYVIGEAELVAMDLPSGRVLFRRELSGGLEDRFGRRPVAFGGSVVIPGDTGLYFINPGTGEDERSLEIPQGSRSTPALWDGRMVTADQRGNLHVVAPDGRSIEKTIPTASQQPIGLAPAISRTGRAVLTGRRGTVSAVDLRAGVPAWERPLAAGETVRVYTDAVIAGNIVYIYGGGRLFALGMDNGRDVFEPVGGVTAPPMIRGNLLVLCRDGGIMTLHDRKNGRLLGEIPLREIVEARPVALGDYILAAGRENALILDPRSITEY